MTTLTIKQLYDNNHVELQLEWVGGLSGGDRLVSGSAVSAADQVGHLNLIHPDRIHVFGRNEISYYERLSPESRAYQIHELIDGNPPAIIVARGRSVPPELLAICEENAIPVFTTPLPAGEVIDFLRIFFSKTLAQRIIMHGVFVDVLGLGVLITGESGLGKSELGLELITREHGLIADDAVEFARIAPSVIEGRCPPLLQNMLEVRGLGLLDIKTIFGEAAMRRRKRLRLIVELTRNKDYDENVERLQLPELTQEVLGLQIGKVQIPVAAGRNLAVLIEAAVRNTILQLRGINTLEEFMERHRQAMGNE